MDPMQLLAIVAVVLAIALVGLTLVVVSMVRNQQQAQKQAARRAVEAEKQERSCRSRWSPRSIRWPARRMSTRSRRRAPRPNAAAPRPNGPGWRATPPAGWNASGSRCCCRRSSAASVGSASGRISTPACSASWTSGPGDSQPLTLAELDARRAVLDEAEVSQRKEIARIAGMTPQAAKAELLAQVEHEARLEAVHLS